MIKNKEFKITDLGYASKDGDYDLPELWGLDNVGDQGFYHKGYEGFPDESNATVYSKGEVPGFAFFVYEGDIKGGAEIASDKVLELLKTKYKWGKKSYIDDNGIPQDPLPHELGE